VTTNTVPNTSGQYGITPYGDGEYGGHDSSIPAFSGALNCPPITPGTVEIFTATNTVTDDGEGNLIGQGAGTLDYRTGEFSVSFSTQEIGAVVKATYMPQEGGCDCGSCKTHKFRLLVVPGTNIGQNQIAVSDAFARLIHKLKTITPIHAVWEPLLISESIEIQVTTLFDRTSGDAVNVDGTGLRVEVT
jgi:hypothetical protein